VVIIVVAGAGLGAGLFCVVVVLGVGAGLFCVVVVLGVGAVAAVFVCG